MAVERDIERAQWTAEIQQTQANAIRTLVDAGFSPTTVVAAVKEDDLSLLEHSGLFSVQLKKGEN